METWIASQFVSDLAELGFFELKIIFLFLIKLYRAYPITELSASNFQLKYSKAALKAKEVLEDETFSTQK